MLRVLGERRYTSDTIFWNSYVFPRIYVDELNQDQANRIWESLIALKVKSPELNCTVPIDYVESLLKKFELIDGFEERSQEAKDEIKESGDLPENMSREIKGHHTQNCRYSFPNFSEQEGD